MLSHDAVKALLSRCLFTDEEAAAGIPENAVKAEGILHTYAFHPDRLEAARPEIRALLDELPDSFMADKGGGMSFLNACVDRDGRQWGEHLDMERLFCLGIATGLAQWIFPRDVWEALPGGMPYVQVRLGKEAA